MLSKARATAKSYPWDLRQAKDEEEVGCDTSTPSTALATAAQHTIATAESTECMVPVG